MNGPILIIEDDRNDAEVIAAALKDIHIVNQTKVLAGADDALNYLSTTTDQPYLIICDIRMPGTDGITFRKMLVQDERLKKKTIPFIYFTAIDSMQVINAAFDLDIQGYFRKPATYPDMKAALAGIFFYWDRCLHPNRTDLYTRVD